MVAMLSPATAISWEMPPTMFGTLALAIATRKGASRGSSTLGKFTELRMVPLTR